MNFKEILNKFGLEKEGIKQKAERLMKVVADSAKSILTTFSNSAELSKSSKLRTAVQASAAAVFLTMIANPAHADSKISYNESLDHAKSMKMHYVLDSHQILPDRMKKKGMGREGTIVIPMSKEVYESFQRDIKAGKNPKQLVIYEKTKMSITPEMSTINKSITSSVTPKSSGKIEVKPLPDTSKSIKGQGNTPSGKGPIQLYPRGSSGGSQYSGPHAKPFPSTLPSGSGSSSNSGKIENSGSGSSDNIKVKSRLQMPPKSDDPTRMYIKKNGKFVKIPRPSTTDLPLHDDTKGMSSITTVPVVPEPEITPIPNDGEIKKINFTQGYRNAQLSDDANQGIEDVAYEFKPSNYVQSQVHNLTSYGVSAVVAPDIIPNINSSEVLEHETMVINPAQMRKSLIKHYGPRSTIGRRWLLGPNFRDILKNNGINVNTPISYVSELKIPRIEPELLNYLPTTYAQFVTLNPRFAKPNLDLNGTIAVLTKFKGLKYPVVAIYENGTLKMAKYAVIGMNKHIYETVKVVKKVKQSDGTYKRATKYVKRKVDFRTPQIFTQIRVPQSGSYLEYNWSRTYARGKRVPVKERRNTTSEQGAMMPNSIPVSPDDGVYVHGRALENEYGKVEESHACIGMSPADLRGIYEIYGGKNLNFISDGLYNTPSISVADYNKSKNKLANDNYSPRNYKKVS